MDEEFPADGWRADEKLWLEALPKRNFVSTRQDQHCGSRGRCHVLEGLPQQIASSIIFTSTTTGSPTTHHTNATGVHFSHSQTSRGTSPNIRSAHSLFSSSQGGSKMLEWNAHALVNTVALGVTAVWFWRMHATDRSFAFFYELFKGKPLFGPSKEQLEDSVKRNDSNCNQDAEITFSLQMEEAIEASNRETLQRGNHDLDMEVALECQLAEEEVLKNSTEVARMDSLMAKGLAERLEYQAALEASKLAHVAIEDRNLALEIQEQESLTLLDHETASLIQEEEARIATQTRAEEEALANSSEVARKDFLVAEHLAHRLEYEAALEASRLTHAEMKDRALASEMQEQESLALLDFETASIIQEEEARRATIVDEQEEAMRESSLGCALRLVRMIHTFHENAESKDVSPIASDDMVFVAQRFFTKMKEFRNQGKPITVDIGYHYTRRENLESIRREGLLSRDERLGLMIDANFNGSTYGDGVYSATSASTVGGVYGNTGLIVARLAGLAEAHPASLVADTVVVSQGTAREFTVMKDCGQCLPLLQFQRGVSDLVLSRYHYAALKCVSDVAADIS